VGLGALVGFFAVFFAGFFADLEGVFAGDLRRVAMGMLLWKEMRVLRGYRSAAGMSNENVVTRVGESLGELGTSPMWRVP
jgi:predicted lipid-binding transport protein (Tim44 family)